MANCESCNGVGLIRHCCGQGIPASYDSPPECCGNEAEDDCEACYGTGSREAVELAIRIADATACDLLRNEGGYPEGDKWLDVRTLDAIADDLKYAALRGFIERHPVKDTQFRFTGSGLAQFADGGTP